MDTMDIDNSKELSNVGMLSGTDVLELQAKIDRLQAEVEHLKGGGLPRNQPPSPKENEKTILTIKLEYVDCVDDQTTTLLGKDIHFRLQQLGKKLTNDQLCVALAIIQHKIQTFDVDSNVVIIRQ